MQEQTIGVFTDLTHIESGPVTHAGYVFPRGFSTLASFCKQRHSEHFHVFRTTLRLAER